MDTNYYFGYMLEEAGLGDIPDWTFTIPMVNPYDQTPMIPRWSQVTGLFDTLNQPNYRYGLYDDMGSGKSLISYAYLAYWSLLGNKCLAIMPPKLLAQYKKNFEGIFKGINKYVSMEVLYGTKAATDKLVGKWYTEKAQPDIILASFDYFRNNYNIFKDLLKCDVIVGDEAKWISNPDNKISKALKAFLGKPCEKAAMMMNGTPARTNLINLYGCIEFTNPGLYYNRDQFERKHVKKESFFIERRDKKGKLREVRVSKIAGYKNQEELFKNLYKQGRRVELPPSVSDATIVPLEIELSGQHRRSYAKLVKDKMLEFPDNTLIDITHSAAARHLCMRAVADPRHLKLDGESELLVTTKEMVQEHFSDEEDNGKILLMAYYRDTVELLLEAFKDYGAVAIYGGVTKAQAEANRQKFINDPDCKVMVVNYESGGVGVDGLQLVCNRGISVEPTGIVGDFQQTVKRLARPGQTKPVTIHVLMPTGTIYVRVIKDRMKAAKGIHSVVSRDKPMTRLELQAELLGEEYDPNEEVEIENF